MKKDTEIYTQCRHELNHIKFGRSCKHFCFSEFLSRTILVLTELSWTMSSHHRAKSATAYCWSFPPNLGASTINSSGICGVQRNCSSSGFFFQRGLLSPRILRSTVRQGQHYAQYLVSVMLFQCAGYLKPLFNQFKWILYMRCSTMCIHYHNDKPLQLHCRAIGC